MTSQGSPAAGDDQIRLTTLIPWGVAAGLALLTAWLGQSLLAIREEAASQRTESRIDLIMLRDVKNQLEAEDIILRQQLKTAGDPAVLELFLLDSAPENATPGLAAAAWNPNRREGVLAVGQLPVLAADQDYQLWLIDPASPDPLDGGAFTVDASGTARVPFKIAQPVSTIKAMAITRERKGGALRPGGPFVLRSR